MTTPDETAHKAPEMAADAADAAEVLDNPSLMEAMVGYLERKGFSKRIEQAEALQLGPTGPIAIARYMNTRRAMRMDVLRRALQSLGAIAHYDGFGWRIEDAPASTAPGTVTMQGAPPVGLDDAEDPATDDRATDDRA